MSGEFVVDELVTRFNYETAVNLSRNLTEQLLDEIDGLAPTYPVRVVELAGRIREAHRIQDRLKRQLVLEVAG